MTVEPGASAALVDAIVTGRPRPGLRTLSAIGPGSLVERPITVDQTNVSVVVGERVVVKWLRTPGPDRSTGLLAHLAANDFRRMPTPHAALFAGDDLVALVAAFLPEALDGWDWGVDAVLAWLDGGPAADFGAELGRLAAELHAALATPSLLLPEPVVLAQPAGDDWRTLLDEAVACAGDDQEWVRSIAPRLADGMASAARHRPSATVQLHGDLHVGQVLKWRDGYAVTDFDGNPTAEPRPEPVARDIAQLRTSVLHVAEIANRRTEGRHRAELLSWGRGAADELLSAYRKELDLRGFGGLLDEELLRPFEIEQECRELVYAARFLPRWRYAPMGVLRSWFGDR